MAAPLCRDGHVERARALRAKITDDPVAAWIADLALAIFAPATPPADERARDPIARTLEQLPDALARARATGDHGDGTSVGDALAHALDWLASLGRTEQFLAVAASLPAHHGLRVARLLQTRGLEHHVRAQITPVRIRELDRGNALLYSELAAAHWSPLVSPTRAGELWAAAWQPATHYDHQARLAPRRDGALQILVDGLALTARAGDAATPARLAELALEIGDWFP